MNLHEYMRDRFLILDGGMGTLLQEEGLAPGERPEGWNLTHPDAIRAIHAAYFAAGADVVYANTFGANPLHYSEEELDALIAAALRLGREAAAAAGKETAFVALDVGPTGRLLKPLGDLDFEDAVSAFAAVVRAGVRHGADLIVIETMSDAYETKAALLAAKENSDLPVFVTNAFGADGKLMTGADPAALTALLEGMGADAIGVNCSHGPQALLPILDEYLRVSSRPIIFKPNAGLPRVEGGKTVYDVGPAAFAALMRTAAERGARVLGGCCGTTPAH
ncbi:MAG: homocysteine S-methyltransferase family protein, partial [Clostridia bacterium]|nr:homocysteine S-methyltransferase family protein [Clostridia bacterium]